MICIPEKIEPKQIKDYLIRKGWVCVNNTIDEVTNCYTGIWEHPKHDMEKFPSQIVICDSIYSTDYNQYMSNIIEDLMSFENRTHIDIINDIKNTVTETFDLHQRFSWFKKFLLGCKDKDFQPVLDDCNYDCSKMQVQLIVNGHTVRIEQFNDMMDLLHSIIEKDVKEQLDFYKTEQAVIDTAKSLIEEKLTRCRDVLDLIENDLWKLDT